MELHLRPMPRFPMSQWWFNLKTRMRLRNLTRLIKNKNHRTPHTKTAMVGIVMTAKKEILEKGPSSAGDLTHLIIINKTGTEKTNNKKTIALLSYNFM